MLKKASIGLSFKILGFLLIFVNFVQSKTAHNDASRNLLSSLSAERKEAVDKLRQQVLHLIEKDYMKDEVYLRRWLEEKDWNVVDAEAMLTQNLQWRKQNRMDSISTEKWQDMEKDYPYQIDTVDKNGSPVATLTASKWDIRRAVSRGRVPRLQRYMFKMLEELTNKVEAARAEGRNVTQWSAVINAYDFGLFKHACPSCVPVWLNFVRSASERYPLYAESITLINVPRALIRILRPIFADDSLKLFGSERNTWMKYLDEKIDKSQRTPEFGGIRVVQEK